MHNSDNTLSNNKLPGKITLIAGNGNFPLELLKRAKDQGIDVYTIALIHECSPEVEAFSKKTAWFHVCQLGKIINQIKKWEVKDAIFLGGITRFKLLSIFKTDFRAVKLLSKMKSLRDDEMLRAIINELLIDGIHTHSPSTILSELVVQKGRLSNEGLDSQQLIDAQIGWRVAETIGNLDIGQTVIAKNGTIIAVEAIEGTDRAIIRAGELSGGGFTVVKLPKPNQDMRVDIPSIGEKTINTIHKAGGNTLILKAGGAMILDPNSVKLLADNYSISIEVFESFDDILGYDC